MNATDTDIKKIYDMDETRLKTVIGEKDLGIYFESNLSFAKHIACEVKKATSVAGLIRKSFTYLDKDMFRTLFTTIVRPHLEYGAPIWNPHSKRLIDLIENVQRRASKNDPWLIATYLPTKTGSSALTNSPILQV